MRIRTIKPEFFLNEDLAALSPLHRILFIGLWGQADNEGRMEDRPLRFKAQILPYDKCDVKNMVDDLEQTGHVQRYVVDGKPYILVPTFKKHQVITGRAFYHKSGIPAPNPPMGNEKEFRGNSAGIPAEIKGKVGREGKGREVTTIPAVAGPVEQRIEQKQSGQKVETRLEGDGKPENDDTQKDSGFEFKLNGVKGKSIYHESTLNGKVWKFITDPKPNGLGLSEVDARAASGVLKPKGLDWTAYGLGMLWFCLESPPDGGIKSLSAYLTQCKRGKTGALAAFEAYETRAAVKLNWFERMVQDENGEFKLEDNAE